MNATRFSQSRQAAKNRQETAFGFSWCSFASRRLCEKLFFALALTAALAFAQPGEPAPMQQSRNVQDGNLNLQLPDSLKGVGIDQKLDQQIPLNLTFRDEAGRDVQLSSFFQPKKPVLLALVYYR